MTTNTNRLADEYMSEIEEMEYEQSLDELEEIYEDYSLQQVQEELEFFKLIIEKKNQGKNFIVFEQNYIF